MCQQSAIARLQHLPVVNSCESWRGCCSILFTSPSHLSPTRFSLHLPDVSTLTMSLAAHTVPEAGPSSHVNIMLTKTWGHREWHETAAVWSSRGGMGPEAKLTRMRWHRLKWCTLHQGETTPPFFYPHTNESCRDMPQNTTRWGCEKDSGEEENGKGEKNSGEIVRFLPSSHPVVVWPK